MRLSDTSASFTLYGYLFMLCALSGQMLVLWLVGNRPYKVFFFFFNAHFCNLSGYFFFSIKLGVMEDHSNRTRLAKLLRFFSSNSEKELTSLTEYVERMKEKQDAIYFMAGTSRKEVSIVR